ncbi:Spliceosome-associated protein 130 B [Linum perenne]
MAVTEEECSNAKSRSSSSSSAVVGSSRGSHYLAKCVLPGSALLHVVCAHFRSSSSLDIVFGKETSIELVVVDEDGVVQSVCEQPVFGTIKDLAAVPWSSQFHSQTTLGKDLLAVISDSGKLSFLTFSNDMHRFFPLTHIQLSTPGNLRHQLGRMLAVHPRQVVLGCFIATSAYEDRLALFSLSTSGGSDIIDKRILYPPENEASTAAGRGNRRMSFSGTIWSMCFISRHSSPSTKEHNPVLAIIINRTDFVLNELLLLGWNVKEHTIGVLSQFVEAGPLAHDIVEVPHSNGFALMFRVGDALLMDLRDAHNPSCLSRISLSSLPAAVEEHNFVEEPCKVHDADDDGLFNVAASALLELRDYDPMCIDSDGSDVKSTSKHMCSWSWEPASDKSAKMAFCVDTGEFFVIEVSFDSEAPKVSLSDCLYRGLPCKALLWVEGGFLAAIVDMGDGFILKVENERFLHINPIQNIAPILDMSIVDYHDEKRDQMFACCGASPEGSLRILRNGITVERLLKTTPTYQGVIGTWSVRMRLSDLHHSFLVLSFVEETRVLSVGVSFTDVTDSVGFLPDVSTLACGLVNDGLLVQIHQAAVQVSLPTKIAHAEGLPLSSPVCKSWYPNNTSVSLGAVGQNWIVVSTSNPCSLYVLGVRRLSAYEFEIVEMQRLRLLSELSCISIPQKKFEQARSNTINLMHNSSATLCPGGVEVDKIFVVGTHRPSVEILCFKPGEGLKVIASGTIALTTAMGTAISGCVPQDVRVVLADRYYVLSGLRNGMLLRFEWCSAIPMASFATSNLNCPIGSSVVNTDITSAMNLEPQSYGSTNMKGDEFPATLQLIASRRIGITPVFLVPLSDSLDADIITLSDRPWLLQTSRHSLSYISISFQSATHATPVCSAECPKGILFVAENSLHLVFVLVALLLSLSLRCANLLFNGKLVEMVSTKRVNVQKFHVGGTPRKILYHVESRLLLVMRTDVRNDTCSSDICCVDPVSGSIVSCFKLDVGETGKSMELVRLGSDQVLVVGTSLSSGPAIMPSGEAESSTRSLFFNSTKGRLLVLCLEHLQNSDTGSMTLGSRAGSSSQRTSPFRDIAGYAMEQLSSSSLGSSPDDTSCDGVKLEETEIWQFRLAYATVWPGMVLAMCQYLDRYFLASAGSGVSRKFSCVPSRLSYSTFPYKVVIFLPQFYVCGFANDNPQRVKRLALGRTRFMIMSLTAHYTRIAVGDCRDGVLFYSYHEDTKKVEQLYCDPCQRLVADCVLVDLDTAVVSDRKGSIAILSCSDRLECNASPESNLKLSSVYYTGEVAMSLKKGSFSYKLPADDLLTGCDDILTNVGASSNTIMASTLLGSIIVLFPLSRDEHELLESVQARLAVHPLTAPPLGNDHHEFRSRENPARVSKILDGDMLAQFLELTLAQQEAILSVPVASTSNKLSLKAVATSSLSVSQVVQVLERVHYALS